MRLWTLHPKYLDPPGLVALWREALLVRAVLRGETKGYRHHPQLDRFRAHPRPDFAIEAYLAQVLAEAIARGYAFNRDKVVPVHEPVLIPCTDGQLAFEWRHLLRKLEYRSPQHYRRCCDVAVPESHPLFLVVPGGVEPWERVQPGG
jgi:hypothetical protein